MKLIFEFHELFHTMNGMFIEMKYETGPHTVVAIDTINYLKMTIKL